MLQWCFCFLLSLVWPISVSISVIGKALYSHTVSSWAGWQVNDTVKLATHCQNGLCCWVSVMSWVLFVYVWVCVSVFVCGQSPVVTCVTSELRSSLATPPQQRESTDDPSKASHTCKERSPFNHHSIHLYSTASYLHVLHVLGLKVFQWF